MKDENAAECQAVWNSNTSIRRRLKNERKDVIRLAITNALFDFSHFNFPKTNLVTPFLAHVWKYCSIPLNYTEAGQIVHKNQIKG